VPWKGHDYAVEVFRRLKRLMRKVRRLGLAEDIVFTGWVNNPARYFAAFDFYLLTSMPLEGVPGAVIEAALAGVPVVGFDCFGVREIPGVRATLVPPRDIQALTAALEQQLQGLAAGYRQDGASLPPFQEEMRRQFDMGRMVVETWDVYHNSIRN
jgi:glycosyltransferase involved in cell wall biosynthesis